MISYTTQLETLRDESREQLGERVAEFSIGKKVSKVEYYILDTKIEGIAKHMAYIYYTTPEPPLNTVLNISVDNSTLTGEISSPIYIEITESGIYYNTTNTFTNLTPRLVTPNSYGDYSIDSSILSGGTLYYFKPYVVTFLGKTYSDIVTFTTN